MPSQFESLSIAILEAWLSERPVLVNGRCPVLQHQCQHSNGGLWYCDDLEWTAALSSVSDIEKQRLGRNGRRFVEQFYSWSRVERAYLDFANKFACDRSTAPCPQS
jgi:glycosyltransferase involved in cell wall biosynthesis